MISAGSRLATSAARHRERAVVRARSRTSEQARPVVHVGRQPRVVERRDAWLADEQVTLAQPRFPVEHLRAQRAVVHEEFRLAIARGRRRQRVGGKRIGDEHLARLDGRHASVVDAPLAAERETEQRDDLARRDLAALRIPERIVILELHEMRRDAQRPARIHLRDRAQILALGRDPLGRNEPARPLLPERRAREELRARVAHASIRRALLVLGDEVDESGEHGLVDRAIVGRVLARAPAESLDELVQLRVHVVPLAQPRERQVVLLGPHAQRPFAVAPLVAVRVPDLQDTSRSPSVGRRAPRACGARRPGRRRSRADRRR